MTAQKRRRINERRRKIYAERQQSKENKNKKMKNLATEKDTPKKPREKQYLGLKTFCQHYHKSLQMLLLDLQPKHLQGKEKHWMKMLP